MFRQYFAGMEHTGLALFAMFLFLFLFAVILLRLFALRSRRDYDAVALLPLDDSQPCLSADRTEVNP